MSKPTLLFCPGAWHTTNFFDKVIAILKPLGYRCITIPMPSVGSVPATKGIDEDIAAIRTAILKELQGGRDVVINAHSWAGIPVSSGLYGLGKDERQRDGSNGAVMKLTFVSSFVIPEGMSLLDTMGGKPDAWVIDEDGNIPLQASMIDKIYHDVPREEAEESAAALRPHSLASLHAKTRSPAAWRMIPVAYLICEDDKLIPATIQEGMVDHMRKAGTTVSVERVASSHCPYLSRPGEVAGFLRRAAGEVFND